MRVLMIAPPGAGKGTQGALIAAHFGIPHIATGELLRDHVARRTALGQAVQTYLDRGELVPDQIVLDMVREAVIAAKAAGGGYVLDGIPRNMYQARALYLIARELGMTADVALHLQADDAELMRRLIARAALEHRSDDTADIIAQRLALYHEVTSPILSWYRDRGILVSVDAMRSAQQVGREILAALEAMRPLLRHVPAEARRPVDLTSLGKAFGVSDPASGTSGQAQGKHMTKVVAFDVNETLLDLRALDAPFEELFGSAALRGQWFAQMLQLSFVGGLTGNYVSFSEAQRAALLMLGLRQGVDVSDADAVAMVNRMESLPPHPEVPDALKKLADTPLTVVALVNSLLRVGEAQLAGAGIRGYFERVISADAVRALKPAAAPYLAVAEAFDVSAADVRLVAAHSWDVSGALAAGCKAAFVARPGMVLSPIGPQPDIIGPDITAVVDQIIATDAS